MKAERDAKATASSLKLRARNGAQRESESELVLVGYMFVYAIGWLSANCKSSFSLSSRAHLILASTPNED